MRLADQFIFPLGNSMLRETAVLDNSGVTPLKLLPCNIVKNLIDLHGGIINAGNNPNGKGAKIEIIFPTA